MLSVPGIVLKSFPRIARTLNITTTDLIEKLCIGINSESRSSEAAPFPARQGYEGRQGE